MTALVAYTAVAGCIAGMRRRSTGIGKAKLKTQNNVLDGEAGQMGKRDTNFEAIEQKPIYASQQ